MLLNINGSFVVLLLIALSSALNIAKVKETKQLKMLHVVMRHGIRTPVSTYPKDPFIDHKFGPNGWGQLTNNGILELQRFGEFLRTRYNKFLGDQYNNTLYYCQATGVQRALSSIMAVNSGLWKPNKEQSWSDELLWLPIPVFSEPLDDDNLLLVRRDCPQYNIELAKVESSQEITTKIKQYDALFAYVQEHSGQKMENFYDIEDIYTTLLAQHEYGLELPKWTEGYFPKLMVEPASMSYALKAYNEKLQKFKGGVLLKKIISDWRSKMAGTLPTDAILYGGHDSTVANLLSTLNIFDPQVPNYGMAVLLELSVNDNKYGLEVFVKNSTESLYHMQIPGCEKFCPLEDVIKLTANVIPGDWEAECATDDENYTTPKQSGP